MPTPPRGHEAIVDAALDAAEKLFASSAPTRVSLRDIAREAGVTYSLLNRHIGTRQDLLDKLLERFEQRWEALQERGGGLDDALHRLLGDDATVGTYLPLLAGTLLDAEDTAEAETHRRHSRLGELLPLANQAGFAPAEARDRVAIALSLVFGWRFFGAHVRDSLGVDDADTAALHREVGRTVRTIVTPAPTGPAAPGAPAAPAVE